MPKTKYEYFDFHNECKNMRWDRISVLLAKLEEDLIQQGYEFCCRSLDRSNRGYQVLPSRL